MRRIAAVFVASVIVLGAAPRSGLAAEAQPGSAGSFPVLKTGYDLAVTNITTLGPKDPCVFCPVIEVKNLGSKKVHGTFQVRYSCNGTVVYPFRDILLDIAPGATQKVPPHMPLDQNFARYGDSVEAKIDVDNRLKEDNEVNNTLARKILKPPPPPKSARPPR